MILLGGLLSFFILVLVHEAGHFYIARYFGVKVLRFSIGFGPSIFKIKDKLDTEYVLSIIPLGGYVNMLQKNDEQHPNHPDCFENKSLIARFLIVLAGPLANLILASIIFTAIFMFGQSLPRPVLGDISLGTIAYDIGLKEKDVIVSVGDNVTTSWQDVNRELLQYIGEGSYRIPIDVYKYTNDYDLSDFFREFDSGNYNDLSNIPNITRVYVPVEDWLVSSRDIDEENPLEKAGIVPFLPEVTTIINQVVDGSAADIGGLISGDKFLMIDGIEVDSWETLQSFIFNNPDKQVDILVQKASGEQENVSLIIGSQSTSDGQTRGILGIIPIISDFPDEFVLSQRYSIFSAFARSIMHMWDLTYLTFDSIRKMFLREVSVDHISGPITIFQIAGSSLSIGFISFLNFLAFFSLSLAIVNLLPIPILDGGHLLLFTIEGIIGREVNESIKRYLLFAGVTILLLLTSLAIFNDVWRILG